MSDKVECVITEFGPMPKVVDLTGKLLTLWLPMPAPRRDG